MPWPFPTRKNTKPQPSYAQPAGMQPAAPKPQPQGQALNATMQPAQKKPLQPGIGAQPAPAAAANQAAMAAERGAPAPAPAQRLAVTKAQPPTAPAQGQTLSDNPQMAAAQYAQRLKGPGALDAQAALALAYLLASVACAARAGLAQEAANANQASMQAAQQSSLAPAQQLGDNAIAAGDQSAQMAASAANVENMRQAQGGYTPPAQAALAQLRAKRMGGVSGGGALDAQAVQPAQQLGGVVDPLAAENARQRLMAQRGL